MLLYDWGIKTGPQERWRIPHFLCSHGPDTLHLGGIPRRGVKGQAHE